MALRGVFSGDDEAAVRKVGEAWMGSAGALEIRECHSDVTADEFRRDALSEVLGAAPFAQCGLRRRAR